MYDKEKPFSELLGKTIKNITVSDELITFELDGGDQYQMLHIQDCCEHVTVEDVIGDIKDLIDSPILEAEEVSSDKNPENVTKEYQDSFTWTFYKLSTIKGSVTIRWYGESNGYYSESVSFCKI